MASISSEPEPDVIPDPDWRKSEVDGGHKMRFEYILESGFWSDVTFNVGTAKEEVKAHKLILSTGSRVFEELFKEDMSKCVFDVPDLELDQFTLLLKFLYTGSSPTHVEECLPAMNAAAKYEVQNLVQNCGKVLGKALTPESAIKVFQQSIKYGDSKLEALALKCICKNGLKIVEFPAFLELSVKELSKILEMDELQVKDETQLFEAVMKWGRAELKRQKMPENPKYLRSVLEEVIYLVRFPQMDPADFSLTVYPYKILLDSDYIAVIMYYSVPADKISSASPGPFNSKPRAAYSPHGQDFVAQRLVLNSSNVMDLATNQDTGKKYIPATLQEHSIRFKSSIDIWATSIGVNSMYTETESQSRFSYPSYKCQSGHYISTANGPCEVCSTQSSDWISATIQMKNSEGRVLASKSDTLKKEQMLVADGKTELYHITFVKPVFIRATEWYVASFTISSGDFYGNQYRAQYGSENVFVTNSEGLMKIVKFEFMNDGNPRYTGTTQGYIPEIGFKVE